MSLSQMQVFNEYVMPVTIETLATMVDKFNAASGGAIRMSTDGFDGDFMQSSFFAAIHGAKRRVDRYAANNAAPVTDLTQLKENSVKVAGGFGPIRYEPSQMSWLNNPTAAGIEVASRNFAESLLQDQLHTALAANAAAMGNEADATNSSAAAITYETINSGHALFGDMSSSLVTDVMSGSMFHKLIGANLANVERLFESNGVRVIDILGKLVVVTDAPALTTATRDIVLSLSDSAIQVSNNSDVITNVETKNGNQRIETTVQMDYSFGLGIKGYMWDEANKSPDDATLATGANWIKVATSIKHTAGVVTSGIK